MAIIAPFRGIFYNPQIIENLTRVVAPPYDVISPEDQKRYHEEDPYNVIRLILGQLKEGDNEFENRYTRANRYFQSWLKEEILIRDHSPHIYVYHKDFYLYGKKNIRKGFIALARLENFTTKAIIPHEKTFRKPKDDRLNLLRACQANFCPIFILYSDPEGSLAETLEKKEAPMLDVVDEEGVHHQIWRAKDAKIFVDSIKDKTLLIADGHHRYESALEFRNEMQNLYPNPTGKEAFNFIMVYLTPMEGESLIIFPFHRIIYGLKGFNGENFLKELRPYFQLEPFYFKKETETFVREHFLRRLKEIGEKIPSFGIYSKEWDYYCIANLINRGKIINFIGNHIPSILRELDVTILHSFFIERLLGIKPTELERHVEYVKNPYQAIEMVKHGDYPLAFLLNPIRVEQLKEIALERNTTPHKTTYFYPKPLSGFIMNKIGPQEFIIIENDK